MFGLMKAKTCGMLPEDKQFRRLHYCGTCKTIGSLYGQKPRLLLNHDTVFLAELLSILNEEKVETWQKSYQSYNCLSLPKDEMPVSLQFAATVNVILAEFKLADHISDTNKSRFKFAYRIFSKDFLIAEKLLNAWNFPLEKVRQLLETQTKRENKKLSLAELALPTAETTATFFAHGVKLIGKENLQNLAREIGFAFGNLIYILDAFEDFEQDKKSDQFNALQSEFGENYKRKAVSILLESENGILSKINELPIPESKKLIFASRLRENLQRKLQTELPHVCYPKKRLNISQRFKRAKLRAKELTANYSWAMALPVFAFVLFVAFVSPTYAREAKSARECAELSFNLMFIGSMFGAVLAFPKAILQEGYTPPPIPTQGRKRGFKDGNNNGCCDSVYCGECCCDCGCEACCDGCDCCDCSCDC